MSKMPSPTLFEWCSASFSSLRKSVHQKLSGTTKADIGVPPSLLAVQSLKGKTAGEKYKDFNDVINTLVERARNQEIFNIERELANFSPTLIDIIKICFGVKLGIEEFIVDGLKSRDPNVIRKALTAHWFFNGVRPNVKVDFFLNEILPFVSLRTRREILKQLSRGLKGHESKAEDFFVKLVEFYGIEGNMNLLTACSENFIWSTILEHKLILPVRILETLYEKYPDLVIRYLQLGNENNTDNLDDKKIHQIHINDYDIFLPKLIKKHAHIFMTLYELTPEKRLNLNKIQSKFFLKNNKNVVIQRPHIYLKLITLKLVQNNLEKEEFETMIENLLPRNLSDYNIKEMLNYIEGYRKINGIQLLKDKYKKIYGKNLLDDPRLNSIIPEDVNNIERLLKMLPPKDLENRVRLVLNRTHETNIDIHDLYLGYLPPNETIPIFKKKISKTLNKIDRIALIGQMIVCCKIYNSKDGLLDVLKYYRDKHKNEQNLIFCRFLEILKSEFDLNTLDNNHWSVLNELIENSYIKQELFKNQSSLIDYVLESSLHNAIQKQEANRALIDKLINITLELKMNHFFLPHGVSKNLNSEILKRCFEEYFQRIPEKYPEHHEIWKRKQDRLSIILNIVKTISNYNRNNQDKAIKLTEYPWILKISEEFFPKSETGFRKERLMKLLKIHARDFYESKINEVIKIRAIESGEALELLKRDPEQILENYAEYLSEAREMLSSEDRKKRKTAKRFISSTKWYHDVPVKFIEKSLNEMKMRGSIQVLGILLPGDSFGKIVEPYLPQETTIKSKENFEIINSILKAIIYTEPPVSFDILNSFHNGDFTRTTEGILMNLIQRINVDLSIEYAKKIVNHKKIAVKKQGIRIMQKVSTNGQFREFLKKMCQEESNVGLKKVVSKMIFDLFVQSPEADTWEMMKTCIESLTVDDKQVAEDLADVRKIVPTYFSNYVQDYLNRIEDLFEISKDSTWRTKCVCLTLESITEHQLSDEISLEILEKYFLKSNPVEISRVACDFAVRVYLLPTSEEKLTKLKNILKTAMHYFEVNQKRFYPWNFTFREFFTNLIKEISSERSAENQNLINNLLELMNSELAPWQEPSSYVALNLYREYLQSSSPNEYGIRCAKRVSEMIEEFPGHEPIADVADCLDNFIKHKIFKEIANPMALKMSVIEGLTKDDDYYGSLVSTQLLRHDEVRAYDERYDDIVEKLKKVKNASVQCYLHKHLNSIVKYDVDL